VDIFFVLSGFLITTLLLEEKLRDGRISLSQFYLRRTLRIFPLYYAILAVMALYFAFGGGSQRAAFWNELPVQITYLSNWFYLESLLAITWSLSTEEQFYLVWPPLLAFLGTRALWPLAAFLLVNQAVNFGLLDGLLTSAGLPPRSLPILEVTFTPILLGVLLAFALRSPLRAHLEKVSPGTAVVALLLVANIPGAFGGCSRLVFQVTTVAVIASVVLRPSSWVVRRLDWRPLAYVGTISYGIYLLHKFSLDAALRITPMLESESPLLVFLLSLAGAIVLAALSFRYYELPVMHWRRRWLPGRADARLTTK
jgi:peptidoglycan/LPS O-acetylase OafA/YrhL